MERYLYIILLIGFLNGQEYNPNQDWTDKYYSSKKSLDSLRNFDKAIKAINKNISLLEEKIETMNKMMTRYKVHNIPYKKIDNNYDIKKLDIVESGLKNKKDLISKTKKGEIVSYSKSLFIKNKNDENLYLQLIKKHKDLVDLHSNFKVYQPYSNHNDVYVSSNTYNGQGVYIVGSSSRGNYLHHTLSQVKYYTL